MPFPMKRGYFPFALGFFSAGYQVVLLRRAFSLFAGSEMAVGSAFFIWMLLYGLGGIVLGRFADRVKRRRLTFHLTFFSAMLLSILLTVLSYHFRDFTGYVRGELISLFLAPLFSFIMGLPCVIFGFTFALVPLLFSRTDSIARAYSLEALGSAGGSIFLLFTHLAGLGPVNSALLLGGFTVILITRFFAGIPLLLATSLLCTVFDFDFFILKNSTTYRDILLRKTTPYSELYLIKEENEVSLFENELPQGPVGEKNTREFLAVLLDYYAPPGKILIIGDDLTLACMLANDVKRDVDIVWWDTSSISVQKKFTEGCSLEKISVVEGDPYVYLFRTGVGYSGIVLLSGVPVNISSSLFYTRDFFREAFRKLKEGGAVLLPAGEVTSSLSPAQLKLQKRLLSTIEGAGFKDVIYPVSSFLHTGIKGAFPENMTPTILKKFLKSKGLNYPYASPENIGYLLSRERIEFYMKRIRSAQGEFSSSVERPDAFISGIKFLSEIANPGSWKMFEVWSKGKGAWFVILAVFLILPFGAFLVKEGRTPLSGGAVYFGGFLSMVYVIYTFTFFQLFHGSLYQKVSLLNTAYFLGIFAGSVRRMKKYFHFSLLCVIFSIFISAVLLFYYASLKAGYSIPEWVFYTATFLSALLISMTFRSASLEGEVSGRWAGILDFADHTGAGLGALFSTFLLLPLTGLHAGALPCAFSLLYGGANYWKMRREKNV